MHMVSGQLHVRWDFVFLPVVNAHSFRLLFLHLKLHFMGSEVRPRTRNHNLATLSTRQVLWLLHNNSAVCKLYGHSHAEPKSLSSPNNTHRPFERNFSQKNSLLENPWGTSGKRVSIVFHSYLQHIIYLPCFCKGPNWNLLKYHL